jgi:predicted acyltransferase
MAELITPAATVSTGTPPASAVASQRLMSIDALRGFDMFWIIGADALVGALHRMSKNPVTNLLGTQLEHCEWQGVRFYDLIFPLFVFIMGVSVVFSLTRMIQQEGRATAIKRVIRRGVLLFVVGLFYSGGFSTIWPDIRLMGVLNRIALCYFFGGLIFCLVPLRGMIVLAAGLLVGYWALMSFVPFPDVRPEPGGNGIISKAAGYTNVAQLNMASTTMIHGTFLHGVNLANYVDQKYLPGRKYDGTFDPEGLLSTLPAVVTCLLGIFAGLLLKSTDFCPKWKVLYLLSFGVAGLLLGFLWGIQFPVIKKIWTSSYVLVAGGFSAIALGFFYQIVDVWKYQKWCQPFVWMGMNSLTVYLASNIIGGFRILARRLVGGDVSAFFDAHLAQGMGDMVTAVTGLLLAFWFVYFLYRRKIFLRL